MTKQSQRGIGRFGCLLAGLLLHVSSYAGDFNIENAWSRATAPGQPTAGVDMSISSKHTAKLVGVASPLADHVAIHSMTHEDGMMSMREVMFIVLPAGKRVQLGESGYHLMLSGLKRPLKAGESIPLILSIEVGKQTRVQINTEAEVRPIRSTQ